MTRTRHVRPGRITAASGRRRRGLRPLAGAMACLVLTGCTAPIPEVTFYANRTTLTTEPTRWCTVDVTATTQEIGCTQTDAAGLPRLDARPGQPVHIDVPSAIGDQPWLVYFRYLDAGGELRDGRSQVIVDGRLAYTLRPFAKDDQLVYVEVLSGFELTAALAGGVDYSSTQAWAVVVEPEAVPDRGTD